MVRVWRADRILGAGFVLAASIGAALLTAPAASAVSMCEVRPGTAAEVVQIGSNEACGATADGTSWSWSRGEGGVGFADSRGGANVAAVGADGGVGAGESTNGRLLAVGIGAQALALGVLESPGTAIVAAGPRSQAYVGDAGDPVLCEGELAAALNIESGTGCLVFGEFRFTTPTAHSPAR